jgi:prepilin-type N-terminal cleavage/methylation domain-containing protein
MRNHQRGTSLLEVLAVMVLFAIMALALMRTSAAALSMRGHTQMRSLMRQIAGEGMEEMAAQNPINLTDADDASASLTRAGLAFTRAIDVTVNADGSRTVDVTVTSTNSKFGRTVTISSTFALWGSL